MLPKEIIGFTAESLHSRFNKRSHIIYLSLLFTVTAAAAALPLINVNVSVHAPGLIRPSVEVTTVRCLSAGEVSHSFLSDNRFVEKGDVLVQLHNPALDERIAYLTERIKESSTVHDDLTALIHFVSQGGRARPVIATSMCRQLLTSFIQMKTELIIAHENAKRARGRAAKLHNELVIADADFETVNYELERTQHQLRTYIESRLSEWESERRNISLQLHDQTSQLKQLEKERSNLIVRSPMRGTLQTNPGIYSGSIVYPNQDLAQISPDTNLIVEVFVRPADIGLIVESMPVRFQVDAYNYNQWGMASGEVVDISRDVHFLNDRPMFKIRCSVHEPYLTLPNGYRGRFKKGMTMQARFTVASRSLWQLLYDKVDDWVNPTANKAD